MNGQDLVQSNRAPLRYSRPKTEDRARNYGQVFLNQADTTPEEWVGPCEGIGTRRILKMPLKPKELEFLSAWAREEKTPDPYSRPGHQLQAAHQVRGVTFIRAIKAWARAEGRPDEDIFHLYANPNPPWPWSSEEEMTARLGETAAEVPG